MEIRLFIIINRSYQVKGDFPKYTVPAPKVSKLENKLPKEIETKLTYGKGAKKNFLAENIKKSNFSPPREREKLTYRAGSGSRSPDSFELSKQR